MWRLQQFLPHYYSIKGDKIEEKADREVVKLMSQEKWFFFYDPPVNESAIAKNLKGFLVGKPNPWKGQLLPGIARAMLGDAWGYLLGFFASRVSLHRESPDKIVVEAKILGVFPFRKTFRG